MTWSNSKDILRKLRQDINMALNMLCEICKAPYYTTYKGHHYCDDCIWNLEQEMEEIYGQEED